MVVKAKLNSNIKECEEIKDPPIKFWVGNKVGSGFHELSIFLIGFSDFAFTSGRVNRIFGTRIVRDCNEDNKNSPHRCEPFGYWCPPRVEMSLSKSNVQKNQIFYKGRGFFVSETKIIRPPKIVATTGISFIRTGGTVMGSSSSTVKSANLPGSILPIKSS